METILKKNEEITKLFGQTLKNPFKVVVSKEDTDYYKTEFLRNPYNPFDIYLISHGSNYKEALLNFTYVIEAWVKKVLTDVEFKREIKLFIEYTGIKL